MKHTCMYGVETGLVPRVEVTMCQDDLSLRIRLDQFFGEEDCWEVRGALAVAEEFVKFLAAVGDALAVEFGFDGLEPPFVVSGVVEDGLPAVIDWGYAQ